MHKKKLLIGMGICGIVLVGTWFVPYKIEATYSGTQPYQYACIVEKDFSVHTVSLLGRKKTVTNFEITPEKINRPKQSVTIQADRFSTKVPVESIPVGEIQWNYADGNVYEGDAFNSDKLDCEISYTDGTRKDLSDFTIKNAPDKITAENDAITTESVLGEQTYAIPIHKLQDIRIVTAKTVYEGEYPSDHFQYVASFDDDTERELLADDLGLPEKLSFVKGENKITMKYLGKEYATSITAKEKTAAIQAAEAYKKEVKKSISSITKDNIFVTVQQKNTKNGTYLLTHIVVSSPSQISSGLSYDSFGGKREYPTSYCKRNKDAVVTNGSYFSYDTGQPACAGLFIKNGKIVKDGTTTGSEVCLDIDGKLFTPQAGISAAKLLKQGVKDVFGTADPLLIQDGKKIDLASQHKINSYYYNRTGIAMVRPGEYYIITAGENNYRRGLSFAEMQSIFSDLGCTFARSLDGGGSSSLVVKNKLLNSPAGNAERPVVDFLAFSY